LNANLFVALRGGFPADLDTIAIETTDTAMSSDGLAYTWRDLERASAMMANLIDSLDLQIIVYLCQIRSGLH
jgi:malonyl-CoA/methylmalonyl-CoA synthetase